MCCLTQAVLALSGSEPLTPIGPDSAPPRGALGYLTGASPRGPETFAPPPPHHCPSSDAWGLFSGPADGGRGHRSGEARPPSRGNCGVLGGCLRSAASQGLLWMAEICDLLESPEPIAAPSITTCRGEGGDCWGGGGIPARGAQTQAPVSLPAAPRSSRAAPAGGSRGTSVGSVSGSPWDRGRFGGGGAQRGGDKCGGWTGDTSARLVRSCVRRQLHVLGERGVRATWRVPLPPRLLRGQLRHQ